MPLTTRPGSFGRLAAKPPPAQAGQTIGVMGGTFNPPHAGHVQITGIALRRLGLDRVWWIVTPGNPLKSNGALPPAAVRVAACRKMVTDPRVVVTAFEEDLGTAFTAETLGFLKHRYRGVRFVWIMGADNLASFHRWQRWRDIATEVPIAVVDRPGWRFRAMMSPAARAMARDFIPESRSLTLARTRPPAWTMLSDPLSPLSSTILRSGLGSGALSV